MKAKLGHYVQWLREGFLQMLRLHPVEAGLIALGCIGCLVAYETDSDDTLVRLALVPLAFAVALAFNNLAGTGPWRKVYWVCWAPFVPFAFWGGLEDWLASEPSFITFGILAPLALARGWGGLSGIRVHTAGHRGQGVAAVVAETHVRLVLRPLQPGVVAYAVAVLDRRPASYERIRAYRTARIPACLRRADDALRAVVPLAPYRALPVRRPSGVRLLCGFGLPACARTATHSDRLAGAPCCPCGKTA